MPSPRRVGALPRKSSRTRLLATSKKPQRYARRSTAAMTTSRVAAYLTARPLRFHPVRDDYVGRQMYVVSGFSGNNILDLP